MPDFPNVYLYRGIIWGDKGSGGSARGGRFMAKSRRSFSGRCRCQAGWACQISPTWDMPAFRSLASLWTTGSIISGSPIPASSMPTSCSAARVSSPWRKASRTPCGRWAELPREHRSDSLSAAFRNLDKNAAADLTHRYEELCRHYGMTPACNDAGIAHENGTIEGSHGHLKRAIADALPMRSSADFDALAVDRCFIDEIVSRQNASNAKRIDIERAELRACRTGARRTMRRSASASHPPAASRSARYSTPCPRV